MKITLRSRNNDLIALKESWDQKILSFLRTYQKKNAQEKKKQDWINTEKL